MTNPTNDEINATLRRLEQTKMEIVDDDDDGPQWQSDAEREGLPLVNVTTDSGAPLLDRDKALAKSLPDCVGLR